MKHSDLFGLSGKPNFATNQKTYNHVDSEIRNNVMSADGNNDGLLPAKSERYGYRC